MRYKEFRKADIESQLMSRAYSRLLDIDSPFVHRLYVETMNAREAEVTLLREMPPGDRAALTAEYRKKEVGIFAPTTKTPRTLALMAEWESLAYTTAR